SRSSLQRDGADGDPLRADDGNNRSQCLDVATLRRPRCRPHPRLLTRLRSVRSADAPRSVPPLAQRRSGINPTTQSMGALSAAPGVKRDSDCQACPASLPALALRAPLLLWRWRDFPPPTAVRTADPTSLRAYAAARGCSLRGTGRT